VDNVGMSPPDGLSSGNGAPDSASPSVRAQLLATEHWSLLASRSTTQGEVLTRISMFLTLTSASLVSLALVGQATRFSDVFLLLAGVVLLTDLVVGLLTQVRVLNVAAEDIMYVLAMNRLRAAYLELDPGIAKFIMSSPHDDMAGSVQTYYFLGRRSSWSHVAGSSMVFIHTVNSALIAILAGLLASVLGTGTGVAAVLAAVAGLAFLAGSSIHSYRSYATFWRSYTPVSPTPTDPVTPP
jgi:hypothetical protein